MKVTFTNRDYEHIELRYKSGANWPHVPLMKGEAFSRDFPVNLLHYAWRRSATSISDSDFNLYKTSIWQATEIVFGTPPGEVTNVDKTCFIVNQSTSLRVIKARWKLSSASDWSQWSDVDIGTTCHFNDVLKCAAEQQWEQLIKVPNEASVDIGFRVKDSAGAENTIEEYLVFTAAEPLFVKVPNETTEVGKGELLDHKALDHTMQEQITNELNRRLKEDPEKRKTFCECWPCGRKVLQEIADLEHVPQWLKAVLKTLTRIGDTAYSHLCERV